MSERITPLDPLQFPLRGRRLIEASAGTGKTWTIAALYLRLVLGHGGDNAFPRPLLPPEILVVTFTNAATRELRDRIRSRLAEAARVFRGQQEPSDPFLQALLNAPEYAPVDARARAAVQLDRAAQWMDEAAIYTIHGWSQRMLNQHAFDSGSLFEQTLDNDEESLRLEVVRDYWRTFCYPLSAAALGALSPLASTPDQLAERVLPLLKGDGARAFIDGQALPAPRSPRELDQQLADWQKGHEEREAQARQLWRTGATEIEQLLQQALAGGILSKSRYKTDKLPEYLAQMRRWAAGEEGDHSLLARFAAGQLEQGTNKKYCGQTPDHPAFAALEALRQHQERAPDLTPVLPHAAHWIRERLETSKRRSARLGFDDLLRQLDRALRREGSGPRLARVIAQQYPVALIDEFQDTDPVQYASFGRIYGSADPDASALLLIGDPKQAIYAFRGADIHTYLQARRDCTGALYTLGTNYRSAAPLVAAVNRLFEQAEARQERGAFRFAREGDNPLPFLPVAARGRGERLEIDGDTPAALTAWWLDEEESGNKDLFRAQFAQRCASEIRRLLSLAAEKRAGLRQPDGRLEPLKPSDLAVLVRTGEEARLIREALAQRGVRSVYLSDRESVFDSAEAVDLWRWLRACAEPEQPALLHQALASATLGLAPVELERLVRDELAWESRVELFRQLRLHWRRHGVLAAIRRLLDAFELPARLLQTVDGERVLTNLLHLAELLQTASVQLDGELALVRYLEEQLSGGESADERILRLESDSERVQVITIHKSKGLEYPLVYLPFISDCRRVTGRNSQLLYHAEDGSRSLELGKNSQAQAQADEERLQEDLRLLYVALTRPVYACWFGLAPLKALAHSALGQLLGGGEGDEAHQCLEALSRDTEIAVQSAPDIDHQVLLAPTGEKALRPARQCVRPLRGEAWWIASYSALCRLQAVQQGPGDPAESPDTARDDTALEIREELAAGQPLLARADQVRDIHRFPKGPAAGTFLHGLLEWAANEGFARVAGEPDRLRSQLQRRCRQESWRPWQDTLEGWLQLLLNTQLPLGTKRPVPPPGQQSVGDEQQSGWPPGKAPDELASDQCAVCEDRNTRLPQHKDCQVSLRELQQVQAEMEFWFSVSSLSVSRLDKLTREYLLPKHARPALEEGQVNGMLKGFIDLMVEHEGHYWVVDYKSNWLGPDSSCYSEQAMREAVLAKRYDLQYLLYVLALHRLLKARLPEYAADPEAGYESRVGGALYLFLRGVEEPQRHGAFVDRPPVELILALDELFEQGEQEVAHG